MAQKQSAVGVRVRQPRRRFVQVVGAHLRLAAGRNSVGADGAGACVGVRGRPPDDWHALAAPCASRVPPPPARKLATSAGSNALRVPPWGSP